jgi:cytochrome c biogenesis protein CcmG/thiol:disulfide interchange protein DsbE
MRRVALLVALAIGASACARPSPRADAPIREGILATPVLFDTTATGVDKLLRAGTLPTVVNVWASWCVPCRAEAPLLGAAAKRYAGRVRFIGIDTQDDRRAGREFMRKFHLPYASAFDPKGRLAQHLLAVGVPTTTFYARGGRRTFAVNGEIKKPELDSKLEQLVAIARNTGR